MEIKIEVPEVTLNTVVGDVVRVDEDGDEYLDGQMTVADKVAQLIKAEVVKHPEYENLRKRVTEIRNQEIREAVKPLVREALERPIRKTNYYGEPVGQETTLSEIIMDEAKKAWSTSKDSYGSRQNTLQDVIAAEVRKHIQGEVAKAVKAAQEAALKAVGDLAAGPVVDAVRKAMQGAK